MKQHVLNFREWWRASAPCGQFWTYFTAAIFFNFGLSAAFFLFNLYLIACGMTESQLGIIGSLSAVGGLLATIPAGLCAQRFGIGRTLTVANAAVVVLMALRVCVLWQPAQLALAVACGMALCCWGVCLSPTVAGCTTEQQRPFAFSLTFASGIGIAGLAGFVVGHLPAWLQSLPHNQPLSSAHAMRTALLLSCATAALSLPLLARLKLYAPAENRRLKRTSNAFLRRFLPAMAMWSLAAGAFPPFANVFFVHHLGVSLQRMGAIFSLSQVAQFAAILVAPLLFRRTGLSFGLLFTQLSTALLLATMAGLHSTANVFWVYCLYMAAQNISEPGIYSLLMDRTPAAERNLASSYSFFISAGTQIIASTAVGAGIVRFGYPVVLATIATLAVAAAILFQRVALKPQNEATDLIAEASQAL